MQENLLPLKSTSNYTGLEKTIPSGLKLYMTA